MVSFGLSLIAMEYLFAPVVPSDRIAAVGVLIAAASVLVFATSRIRNSLSWGPWTALALALFIMSFSNLVAITELGDPASQQVAGGVAVLEAASGAALFRWARARRLLRAA